MMRYIINGYEQLLDSCNYLFLLLNIAFYIARELRHDITCDISRITKNSCLKIEYKAYYITPLDFSIENIFHQLHLSSPSEEELLKAKHFFEDKNIVTKGRGHNQLWIIQSYLELLYKMNKDGKLTTKLCCPSDCSSSIVSSCAACAYHPEELLSFVKSHAC